MECIFLPKSGQPAGRPVQVSPRPPVAVPVDRWPLLLRAYARRARPGDAGLGDVLEREIGAIGGRMFKRLWLRATGRPCGCGERRDWLNARYPLPRENVVDPLSRPGV